MSYAQTEQSGLAEGSGQLQFQLTPLTTGQILDRTFVLYRSRFGLFAGLAVFPSAVALLFGLLQLAFLLATHTPLGGKGAQAFSTANIAGMGIGLVGALAKLCVYGISIAASAWCIARIYLGEAATMRSGFDFAFRHWLRYIFFGLAQVWFAVWLPMVVGSVVIGATMGFALLKVAPPIVSGLLVIAEIVLLSIWATINITRVSLAISACVVEELSIRAAIRRSRVLLATRKIRVFLLFLFIGALGMVFTVPVAIVTMFGARHGQAGLMSAQMIGLGLVFVSNTLLSPLAAIGLCLFYFDERVRREGFDIEFLMQRATPVAATVAGTVIEPGSEIAE